MDIDEIRRLAITALFSDEVLMDQLVLKGGNAINLVYRYTVRSSKDLDFSMEGDFVDVDEARTRIFRTLKDRFEAVGLVVFDEQFRQKPSTLSDEQPATWGGYELSFKLISYELYQKHKSSLEQLQRNASITGVKQARTLTVELSKYEYCEGKNKVDLDDFSICVFRAMPISVPKGWRSRFRTHADHHSEVMAITIPNRCRSLGTTARRVC